MNLDVISKKTFEELYRCRKKTIFLMKPYGFVEIEYTGGVIHKLVPVEGQEADPLPVFDRIVVPGTGFQAKVWSHLITIQQGFTTTYGDISKAIGHPGASRAVGQAVGANPVGILIPCHRVLSKNNGIGGFAWGTDLKKKWLSIEINDN